MEKRHPGQLWCSSFAWMPAKKMLFCWYCVAGCICIVCGQNFVCACRKCTLNYLYLACYWQDLETGKNSSLLCSRPGGMLWISKTTGLTTPSTNKGELHPHSLLYVQGTLLHYSVSPLYVMFWTSFGDGFFVCPLRWITLDVKRLAF